MARLDKNTGLILPGSSAGESGGGGADLSFITAEAADIKQGKIGADRSGNPVHGTLDGSSGGYTKADVVKNVLIFG